MTKLRIAEDLALPLDAVTQAIGVVAKRRVGKSYTARRFAEQLHKAGQQIVIIDPKGDYWGIRSSADGRSAGLPVVILGGEHGDLALDVTNGEVVAKLVVDERVSVLLDLSQFRKREVARFMTDFLEALYRLKAKESNRTPLMLIVDEADAIAPQKPQEGEERMLGAAEDIVRRGGQRGIGCMMITQRTAVLNKNVLTQCEMLIALRTIAPQDLKAMQAWIDVHGSVEERDTLMASLPSLPQGDAWFWSPGWPTSGGIFQRVHVLPIETFDSGATPKPGEKRIQPKNLADVDLGALSRQMAATIERAKADDPNELRKQIATLKKQLAAASAKTVEKPVDQKDLRRQLSAEWQRGHQVGAISTNEWVRKELAKIDKHIVAFHEAAEALMARMVKNATDAQTELDAEQASDGVRGEKGGNAPAVSRQNTDRDRLALPISTRSRESTPRTNGNGASSNGVGKTGKKILGALAFYESIGKTSVPAPMLAAFVGMSASGGSWGARVSELRSSGYVDGSGALRLTAEGRSAADTESVPSSLKELHDMWRVKLGGKAREMLNVLIDAYPEAVSRETLAEAVDMEASGGSFGARLSEIRSPGLLDSRTDRGELRASDVLFPAGLS